MHNRLRSLIPLALAIFLGLLLVFTGLLLQRDADPANPGRVPAPPGEGPIDGTDAAGAPSQGPGHPTAAAPPVMPAWSILAEPPDWQALEPYQETITRDDFEALLSQVFTTGDSWKNLIEIGEDHARIKTNRAEDDDHFVLRFVRGDGFAAPVERFWRPAAAMAPAPENAPLDGIHIAIDAGHIGGEWARMEERWFSVNGDPPVTEGDMTLKVARMLKPRLEEHGARVTLVRDASDPITPMRPEMLHETARDQGGEDLPGGIGRLAERLFYRTAEIRARAFVVNQSIRPDLVICLHFNAEAWGDPTRPTLVDESHFHILLNGGYTDAEVAMADQRFAMLRKLLQRTHEEEVLVGATVVDRFAEASGLPPYRYPPGSGNARAVGDHPFLWARNLLANRLYDCPVLFMEPYVMNSKQDYARIQAGDYPGLREINGRLLPSIYREYVDGLVDGLVQHYRRMRGIGATQ